jgi:hypothetical protein
VNHATAVLRLRGSPVDRRRLECAAVDAVWAGATPGESVEHVHARVVRDRLHVTVFLIGRSPVETWATVTDICRRTISASPFLSRMVQGEVTTTTMSLKPVASNSPHVR